MPRFWNRIFVCIVGKQFISTREVAKVHKITPHMYRVINRVGLTPAKYVDENTIKKNTTTTFEPTRVFRQIPTSGLSHTKWKHAIQFEDKPIINFPRVHIIFSILSYSHSRSLSIRIFLTSSVALRIFIFRFVYLTKKTG